MTSKSLIIASLSLIVLNSCQPRIGDPAFTQFVRKEVPRFLAELPNVAHDSFPLAFKQMNEVMKYELVDPPTSPRSMEAKKGLSTRVSDGQIILLAGSKLPNSKPDEFGVSIIVYPTLADTAELVNIMKEHLSAYPRKDTMSMPTWRINGWLLQVKGNNTIVYYPVTTSTLFDKK